VARRLYRQRRQRFRYGNTYDPSKCVGDKSPTGGYSGKALAGQPGYFAAGDMNNNNPRNSTNNTRGFRCCQDK
jgi:hypothetical protein